MNEQNEQKAATPTEVRASNPFSQANEQIQAFIKTPEGKLKPTSAINKDLPLSTPNNPPQLFSQVEEKKVAPQERVQIMNKADLQPVTSKVESSGLFGRIKKILGR